MPRPRRTRTTAAKSVVTLRHEQDTGVNVPTAEYQSLVREEETSPGKNAYAGHIAEEYARQKDRLTRFQEFERGLSESQQSLGQRERWLIFREYDARQSGNQAFADFIVGELLHDKARWDQFLEFEHRLGGPQQTESRPERYRLFLDYERQQNEGHQEGNDPD